MHAKSCRITRKEAMLAEMIVLFTLNILFMLSDTSLIKKDRMLNAMYAMQTKIARMNNLDNKIHLSSIINVELKSMC